MPEQLKKMRMVVCVCGGGGVVLLVLQVLKAATKPDLTKL